MNSLVKLIKQNVSLFLSRKSVTPFSKQIRFSYIQLFIIKHALPQLPNKSNFLPNTLLGVFLPVLLADTKSSSKNIKILLDQCDDYYNATDYEQALTILKDLYVLNDQDVEVLWRLSRCLYKIAQTRESQVDTKEFIYEAYSHIENALKLDEENPLVHKWKAIILDEKMKLEGTKARICQLPTFRHHLNKAVELNPKDATVLYMLGFYCFSLAELSWYQRKLAETAFAKIPDETYENALQYFLKAEEIEPNFYSSNLLMLGKTYLRLKLPDLARHWLQRAANYPANNDEDENVRIEAAKLLKNL